MTRRIVVHDRAAASAPRRDGPATTAAAAALSDASDPEQWLTNCAQLLHQMVASNTIAMVGIARKAEDSWWGQALMGFWGSEDRNLFGDLRSASLIDPSNGNKRGPFVRMSAADSPAGSGTGAEDAAPETGVCAYLRKRRELGLHQMVRGSVVFGRAGAEMLAVVQVDGLSDSWIPEDGLGAELEDLAGGIAVSYFKLFAEPERVRAQLLASLSEMQRKIVPLLIEEKSEREIADLINRSKHTVHEHVKAVYQSWGVRSRHQARELWLGRGERTR